MAKKRSSSSINMAAEIRALLKANRAMSGREVYEALTKKFPKQKINENSCSVAFSGARKKLGIKVKRKRKRGAKKTVVRKRAAAARKIDLAALQAAARFVSQVGDADRAIDAIRQVRLLQVG
ncbi:MAG: hypothetical protein ACE5KM_13420 [Planctomycetaceae bacterium]